MSVVFHNMWHQKVIVYFLLVFISFWASISNATTAYVVTGGHSGNQIYTGSLGMDFDVVSPITITDLGAFDDGSNGLFRTITVRVFDRENSATPLAELVFSQGSPGTLEGGSRIKPLPSPLNLAAGFKGSIVAIGYGAGELNHDLGGGSNAAMTTDDGGGLITFGGSGRFGLGDNFPATVDGGPVNRYGAGTFKFDATAPPSPLAEYRFEELSWNGTAGEVIDSSGNGYHGRMNHNSVPEKTLSALSGNPGTCGYASQNDGAIEVKGLPLDTLTNGVKTTVTFWMNWDGTNSAMPIGWDTHDIWLVSNFIGFNTGNGDVYGTSSAGLANGWHHIAVEFTNGNVTSNRMHIDGVEQVLTQRQSSPNNSRAIVDSELRIGGWSRSSGYDFHGLMDEVRVYQGTLTTPQVSTIMTERHPCAFSPIREYRFDELEWVGLPNEVIDSTGSSSHGTALGGIMTAPGKVCHAAVIPSNTSASTYEAVDTETDLDAVIGSSGTISLWYKGGTAWNSGSDKRLFDATDGNKYFFAEIKSDGRIKFWFEDGNDGDYQKTTVSAFAVGAGVWKHLTFVWDVGSGTAKIFVDGVEQSLSGGSGGTIAFTGYDTLYFGDNRDASYYTGQSSAGGLIDEALVFDSVLTLTQIQAIFTNQNAGNNYDGSPRTCPTPVVLLAEYRFEEESWNGSAGEVLDSSGNGYHGRVNNNSTPETDSPALSGNPGTCGYASQNDGSIQVTGLPLDTSTSGVKTTVTFWMNWDGTNSAMPIGWYIHDVWIVSGSIGFNTGSGDVYGTSSAGLANGWHHIAVEFTNGSVTSNRIHIDGIERVLSQRNNTPNNSRAFVNSELRIGGWSANAGYDFHGLMDEVRVYQGALSTAQVVTVMGERYPCDPAIHHYEISHDGEGLTCDTELVTIKACTDESCTSASLSTESVTLDFLAGGVVTSSPTFTGSVTVGFNHTVAETLAFSVANASLIASDSLVCDDSSGHSCEITFTEAGFRFLYGAGNSTTLPNQTSGSVFADVLKIQAVKDTNGVCTGLFAGDNNVDLSQENVDPGGSSGLSFSVDSDNIAKHSSATSTTLNFGADSIATIPAPIYHDAGNIRLHANYDVAGVALSGSSNAFWVSPAELVISATSGAMNLNGATATAGTTYAAGENFNLTVSAYNAATPSVVTPNYSPGKIQLRLERTGPTLSSSVDGSLMYAAATALVSSISPVFQNVALSNFASGVSTYNAAQYSEVGLLNLDVQDSNYGNASIAIPATAINMGRFTPEHFKQTVVQHGLLHTACGTRTSFAAYTGQKDETTSSRGAISYLANPILAITAYNKQGNITQNYYEDSDGSVNDYMKLYGTDIGIAVPTSDQVATGVNSNILPLTANMNTGVLSQNDLTALPSVVALPKGVLHYQLSGNDNFYYNRSANALVGPFTSDIDFSVAAIADTDTVNVTTTVDASPAGVEIRFGRLVLDNSFGPETVNLPQPMRLEHFDGSAFTVSSDNSCTSYDASKITLSNMGVDPALTSVLGGAGNFLSGKTQAIELQAPGVGNQGQIGVIYEAYDWLKHDWDNDGSYDDPSAVATFGVFRGNDRVIYRQLF